MKAYSSRRLANRCRSLPGIFPSSDFFRCTTSSCDSDRMKFSLKA